MGIVFIVIVVGNVVRNAVVVVLFVAANPQG